jgi:NAD(P)-dependent dehydrogenase (short-subunit alcohol dehydrogenase family)/GNAT superfamily N-acetyltransferase
MTSFTLRAATADDTEAIARVWHNGWPDGHVGHVPEQIEAHRRLADFRRRVPSRIGSTTVAVVDSQVVGFVTVHDDEVEQLYVARAARGTGVAAALLTHAEHTIAGRSDTAWMAVVAGNARARRFYARQGWQDAGSFDYAAEVEGGTMPVPARRYEKRVTSPGDAQPQPTPAAGSLAGRVALVAGATRAAGRGIAEQLGAAGATVYVTGRTTRSQRSEMDRPETIEETAALVDRAGGRGVAVQVDHLAPTQVEALIRRIEAEQGGLHVLVNNIWGATTMEWNKSVWESSLDIGLRTLRLAVETHAITSHFALPLMISQPGGLVVEVTDGTAEYNAANYRVSFFYDLAKAANLRMAFALAHELRPYAGTAVALTPGWLRSEAMLDAFGVTESTWQEATKAVPHFAISESPAYLGRAVAALAADPDRSRWNGASLSSGQLAKVYGFTDVDGSQPDAWRYLTEVQDAGKPADTTGYR